jgi:hypothetical protein
MFLDFFKATGFFKYSVLYYCVAHSRAAVSRRYEPQAKNTKYDKPITLHSLKISTASLYSYKPNWFLQWVCSKSVPVMGLLTKKVQTTGLVVVHTANVATSC